MFVATNEQKKCAVKCHNWDCIYSNGGRQIGKIAAHFKINTTQQNI